MMSHCREEDDGITLASVNIAHFGVKHLVASAWMEISRADLLLSHRQTSLNAHLSAAILARSLPVCSLLSSAWREDRSRGWRHPWRSAEQFSHCSLQEAGKGSPPLR